MTVSSFPKRNEDSFFAQLLMHESSGNRNLYLFVEDEKRSYLYRKIIERRYSKKTSVFVYCNKSKSKVINNYHYWEKEHSKINNIMFIVDKDFSEWNSESDVNSPHFLQWKFYTIENYLIDKESSEFLLESVSHTLGQHEVEKKLQFNEWLEETYCSLENLFITYAIAHKYSLCENTSLTEYKYFDSSKCKVRIDSTVEYIESVKALCLEKGIDFMSEFNHIREYYLTKDRNKYHELIKGKYYLTYLIEYINKLGEGNKYNVDSAVATIISNINLDNFFELWEKLNKLSYGELASK